MNCPLPAESAGYKAIQKYQKSRDLIREIQKRPATRQRRQALIDARRQDYFKERLNAVDKGAYRRYQLDNAKLVRDIAINASQEDAQPSTSYARVKRTEEYLQDVMCATKRSAVRKAKKATEANKRKQASMKSRNKTERAARKAGSNVAAAIRNEHPGYASLTKKN